MYADNEPGKNKTTEALTLMKYTKKFTVILIQVLIQKFITFPYLAKKEKNI